MQKQTEVIRYGSILAAIVTLIVLIPLAAMFFTNEVAWSAGDFIFAWAFLFGAGMVYKLVTLKMPDKSYRIAVGLAVGTSLFLVWVNLAVGIIGSEDNNANVFYFGVLLIEFAGALITWFRPSGMAVVMFLTAAAQMLVPVIALIIYKPDASTADALTGIIAVFGLSSLFAVLFAVSGLQFKKASENMDGKKAGS